MHLPLWLPAETARTAWDVDTTRARELGLASRPLARDRSPTPGRGADLRAPAAARATGRPGPAARAGGAAPRRALMIRFPDHRGSCLTVDREAGPRPVTRTAARAGSVARCARPAGRRPRLAATGSTSATTFAVVGRPRSACVRSRRRPPRRTRTPGPCGTGGRSARPRRPRRRRAARRPRSGPGRTRRSSRCVSSVRVLVSTIMPPTSEPSMRGGMWRTSQAAIGAATRPPASRPQRPGGVDALRAEREQEAEAGGDRDQELRGVDRADHLARLHPAAGQDRRGADRAPAAATGGVDEAGDQAERAEEALAHRLAQVPAVDARGR